MYGESKAVGRTGNKSSQSEQAGKAVNAVKHQPEDRPTERYEPRGVSIHLVFTDISSHARICFVLYLYSQQ